MSTMAVSSRPGKALVYGLAAMVGLFWLMHVAIEGGVGVGEKSKPLPTIDFVRLKKDSDLETRERRKPPKPEPPKQPPPPKMQVEAPPPDAPVTPFTMPKLDLPTNVTGGPFMGNYVAGDSTGYGDLTPMVRIQPQYPRQALRDGIEGSVLFELTINPDGTVKAARVLKATPRNVFESAALASIYKWKFKPKLVDGKGVESKGTQLVEFKLAADDDK